MYGAVGRAGAGEGGGIRRRRNAGRRPGDAGLRYSMLYLHRVLAAPSRPDLSGRTSVIAALQNRFGGIKNAPRVVYAGEAEVPWGWAARNAPVRSISVQGRISSERRQRRWPAR